MSVCPNTSKRRDCGTKNVAVMRDPHFYIQLGNDTLQCSKLLLELVIQRLENAFEEMKQGEMSRLGKGFESVVRPWALVFMKNDENYKKAIQQRATDIQQGLSGARPTQRVWFDSIQVCRTETIHQLRGVMCALHVKEYHNDSGSTNILRWMIDEKDNQPPCLIVVVDLIDLLLKGRTGPNRFLHLQHNELAYVLANLLESCEFESTTAKKKWEKTLKIKMKHTTNLLIADQGCLPPMGIVAGFDPHTRAYVEKLYQIIHYYIEIV